METTAGLERTTYTGQTLAVWGAFLLIGLQITVFGPTLPILRDHFTISMTQAGLFVSLLALGRTLSVMASGLIADRLGRKPVLVLGTSCLALGLMGIVSVPVYAMALGFAVLSGVGQGMVDTAGTAAIADMHPAAIGRYLNLAHMFVGIGGLVGPLFIGFILSASIPWQAIYYTMGTLGAIIGLTLSRQQLPVVKPSSSARANGGSIVSIATVLLGAVMFIYSGVGQSLHAWTSTYVVTTAGTSLAAAASFLGLYSGGIIIGRLACSIYGEQIGYRRGILIMSVLAGGALGVVVSTSHPLVLAFSLIMTGIGFGGLFPTTLAIANQLYPGARATISGMLVMLAALGGVLMPAGVGAVSEAVSLQLSFQLLFLLVLTLVIVAIVLQRNQMQA